MPGVFRPPPQAKVQISGQALPRVPTNVPAPLAPERPRAPSASPAEPKNIDDTGLSLGLLADLALKGLYYSGAVTGLQIAEKLRLPFANVAEKVLEFLVSERLADLTGGKGFGRVSTEFDLTEKGREYAKEALSRNGYVGAAPVPLEQYKRVFAAQRQRPDLTVDDLREGLKHLVVSDDLMHQLGPAVNSGRSIFLYGPPGNGKTSLAEAVAKLLGGEVFVPNALELDGQIIKVFDPMCHVEISASEQTDPAGRTPVEVDRRWRRCRRPTVMVGGELTLQTLDLIYAESARFYEAPFQVKANGGMLLIDDFGRQRVPPADLLNRWIVPLEKRIDFLTLHTGKKFEMPFDQLIAFSTNLNPRDLVDEAFLRRIKYKIEIPDPTEEQYRDIFKRVCEAAGVPYVDAQVTYLIQNHYRPKKMALRASHPRDLVNLIKDSARYWQVSPSLSRELIDQAVGVFLVALTER